MGLRLECTKDLHEMKMWGKISCEVVHLSQKFSGIYPRIPRRFLSSSFVVSEQKGAVCSIRLNRPSVRNAVNEKTASELRQAFERFERDDDSLVAVLSGSSGNFCAGYDLKEISKTNTQDSEAIVMKSDGPMGPTRHHFAKPIIGAISGHAVGGGMELALLCDLRVVEEDAVMGFFNRRFGVPLIDGGTVRLTRHIGLSRAMDLILTGRAVKAKEALSIGLANYVVPKGTAYEEALKLANQIARFPQACLTVDRQSAYYAAYNSSSIEDSLDFEKQNGQGALMEAVKGARLFVSGVGHGGKFEESQD